MSLEPDNKTLAVLMAAGVGIGCAIFILELLQAVL